MPSLQDQKADVRRDLQIYGQIAQYPQVPDDEVDQILDACRRAGVWIAATAYVNGDVVMPTTRNGHRYICIESGTSGATEPAWPTGDLRTIQDGTTARWREDGGDYANVYDLRDAIHRCWLVKAQKVAHLYDIRQSQSGFTQSQMYDQCVKMAEKYAPLVIV